MSDRTPMANIPPFGLRMQPDLKARVEEAARANTRSLNAEIVARLEASLRSVPVADSNIASQLARTIELQTEAISNQKKIINQLRMSQLLEPTTDYKELEYLRRAQGLIGMVIQDIIRSQDFGRLYRLSALFESSTTIEGEIVDRAEMKKSALALIDLLDEPEPTKKR
jgi:hypothetical protein